jgi:hypothetical protein
VRVFRQTFTLEDAIGSHACSLEANMSVTNAFHLGWPLPLTVVTVNSVQTLKATTALTATLTLTLTPTMDSAQTLKSYSFEDNMAEYIAGMCFILLVGTCASSTENYTRGVPLSFMPLLRLKRCHACDRWHSSRVSTASYRLAL